MKYIFLKKDKGTHKRLLDNQRGNLIEIEDSKQVHGILVNPIDYIIYVEPVVEPIIEIDIQSLKIAKRDELANERWKAEVSGIEINGMQILTDFNTQSKITAAYLMAYTNPTYTINWKTLDGFVTLNASQIMMIGNAIREHIQFQFDKEMELLELLDNAETEEDINGVIW